MSSCPYRIPQKQSEELIKAEMGSSLLQASDENKTASFSQVFNRNVVEENSRLPRSQY